MTDPTTPAARPVPADVAGLVERATAALDGVTPGPWSMTPGTSVGMIRVHEPALTIWGFTVATDVTPEKAGTVVADARFIAASRQLVPDLTAALEAQAQQIADLTETVAEVRAELDQMIDIAADWRSRAEKAEAENARLREALESIAYDREADYPPSHGAIKYTARAALKGGDNG